MTRYPSWTSALACSLALVPYVTLAAADSAYTPRNASAVLDLPVTVQAGEDTIVHLNISNSAKAEYEHKYMEIFARAITQKETKDDPTSGELDLYCK